jgi:membrane-bound ClpP family serine protease
MSSEPSKNPKSYRTAAILFSTSGLIFIIVAAVSSKVGVFLAPGIALVIIGIALWQHSKKLTNVANNKEI